jgi:hypothetical protein
MKDFFRAYYEKTGHRWELMLPETPGEPYDYVSHEKARDLYLACFPQEVLRRCETSLARAEALAKDAAVKKRIRLFRDGFEYSKLTTLGFARLKEFEKNRSEENLATLRTAVDRRNRFVNELFERQKNNRDDLPEAFTGSLDHLLYGSNDQLSVPFRTLPKAATRTKAAR